MAVVVDQLTQSLVSSAGASPATFNANVTAGGTNRYMLLVLEANDSSTPANDVVATAVTCGGSNMTQLVKARNPDATRGNVTYMFGMIAPATGTPTISYNLGASNYSVVAEAISLVGVNQSTPVRATASGIGNTQFPTVTLSSATGDTAFDAATVFFVDTTALTFPTGGQTKIWYGDSLEAGGAGSREDGAASMTMSWDFSNVRQWSEVAVSLQPAGATTSQTQTGKANIASASSQYGRPSSDITAGGWTSSSAEALYTTISGLNPTDPKYIYSADTTSNTSEVKLSSLSVPISVSGHVVTIRAKSDNSSGTLTVALYQGATLIQSNTFTSLTTSFATYGFLITPANVATISDYTDLRLRFTAGP